MVVVRFPGGYAACNTNDPWVDSVFLLDDRISKIITVVVGT